MKKITLAALSLLLISCQKEVDFLYRQPEPPPAPSKPIPPQTPHHSKTYTVDVSYTNITGAKVDILWMIDNSSSMGAHQNNVIQNTALFMQNFTSQSQLEWRMGLISSSLDENPYLGFGNSVFDWKSPDPVSTFQKAVGRLGTSGDYEEKTMDTVMKALQRDPNFLRPDAFLALIIVTDEDDTSRLQTSDFLKQIANLKGGDLSKFLVFGAYGDRGNCQEGSFGYPHSRYEQLMQATNSTRYVLCAPDFGKLLSDLGSNLIEKITVFSTVIALERRPVVSSIRVTYRGALLKPGPKSMGGDWTYDPVYNLVRLNDSSFLSLNDRDIHIEFDLDPAYDQN